MLVQKVLKWMAPLEQESEVPIDPVINTQEYTHPSPKANSSISSTRTAATSLLTYGTEFYKNNFDEFDMADGDNRSFVTLKSNFCDRNSVTDVKSFVSFPSDSGDRNAEVESEVDKDGCGMKHVEDDVRANVKKHCDIPMGAGDGNKVDVKLSPFPEPLSQAIPKKSSSTQTEKKAKRAQAKAKKKDVVTADVACECKEEAPSSKAVLKEVFCSPEAIGLDIKERPTHQKIAPSEPEQFEGVYGELAVLGCNGQPPEHLAGQMQSRYRLTRRPRPNGVKEAYSFVSSHKRPVPRASDDKLAVFYQVSNGRSVVVEYARDPDSDMFQIGRFETRPVDFRVQDVKGSRNGVSRFACRIVVRRQAPHEARLFAAAFDPSGNIFLGEGAQTLVRDGKMDGFTTNGVLLMQPRASPLWREVSVGGHVYPLRSPSVEATRRPRLRDESNVLRDGALIDLCGVTLVWRSPQGLRAAPARGALSRVERELKSWTPEFEIPPREPLAPRRGHTVLFQSCGHVVSLLGCDRVAPLESWTCPVCRAIGPMSRLEVGREPCFYADCGFLTHAFRPCGHATSLKTALYWAAMKIPEHRTFQEGLCPFCGVKLNFISKYVELKYPE